MAGVAKEGSAVKVFYRGTLEDGHVFDTNFGGEPLAFHVGAGEVIGGFDEAVRGMRPGERKLLTIPVEQAYGERDEEMVLELPRTQMPSGELTVGLAVQFHLEDGEEVDGILIAVGEDSVTVDFNHPLAGKDLVFEIEVVSVD